MGGYLEVVVCLIYREDYIKNIERFGGLHLNNFKTEGTI